MVKKSDNTSTRFDTIQERDRQTPEDDRQTPDDGIGRVCRLARLESRGKN